MKSKITVIATIQAKPGKEEAFREAILKVMRLTHEESGCLHYSVHQGSDRSNEFVTIERWAHHSDLDLHMQTPHLMELLKRVPELVQGAPKIEIFHQIGDDSSPKTMLERE